MNTVIATNYVTAADFIAATVPPTTAAYRLGALSAQLGEVCCPEVVFVRRTEMKEFCRGFVSVAGHTITTRHFLGAQ